MSHRAAVHRLETEFADAMTRMYAVGNDLARLRAELDLEVAAAARSAAPSAQVPSTGAGMPSAPPRAAPTSPPPASPPVPWYRREGAVTRVLAVTGALVTMAGVAMLLVLAVRQGWFGPPARVAAGAALAALLLALGVRGGEVDRRATGAVGSAPVALVATGAAAAYLDVVAVTSGYGWLPPTAGLLLAGAVAVLGLHLARRWGSELLAVLLLLGAAGLAPAVARGSGWVVSAFLGILCVVGWWAGGAAPRPLLTVVRVLPVTLSLLVGAVADPGNDSVGLVLVGLVVLFSTVVTSTLSVRRHGGDTSASAAVALLGVGLLATTATLSPSGRSLVLGGSAATLLLTAAAQSRRPVGPLATHLVATVGVVGTTFAVLAVVAGAPQRLVGTGLLLLALAGLLVAGATRSRLALALAGGATAVAVLAWLPHALAVATVRAGLGHDMVAGLLDSLLVLGVVVAGRWATDAQRDLSREVRRAVALAAWVVALGATVTGLVAAGILVGSRLGNPGTGFTTGHAVATVTWMLAAAWLLLRGLGRSADADLTVRTGLVLAGVAVAKLFLFDLAALGGLVRSVAFLAVGLLLLATGSRYARAYERSRPTA
jgi:uncharacterized membrane protein